MQPTRWLPCTLVALLAACGPATGGTGAEEEARRHLAEAGRLRAAPPR